LGYIFINTTTSPGATGLKVPAGGTVNLYFGGVTWSGAQFYLLTSSNGFAQINNSTQYSPTFTVADLTQLATFATYTNVNGTWNVGMNWVNGSIPLNLAGGNYYIKAFDGSAASVAVTGTYVTIAGGLQLSPVSGPVSNITLTGHAFGANSLANLTYYNTTGTNQVPIAYLVPTDAQGQFNYTVAVPDLLELVTPTGDQAPKFTTIVFNAKDSLGEANATYNEFARGLKQIESQPAIGLWGNATDFSATVVKQVGQTIRLVGKYFYPSVVNVFLDSTTFIGTTVANATGDFDVNVTVPNGALTGSHWVVVQDADGANFFVRVYVSTTPDIYEPDNSFTQYSTMDVASTLQAQSRSIAPVGDNDYIRFHADYGTYIFYTSSSLNTVGDLFDASANTLAHDDDSGGNFQFKINYTITASGYYFLRVRDYSGTTQGLYTLFFQAFPDTTPPTTINNYDGNWHGSDFVITLSAVDNGSGVQSTWYKINSGPTRNVLASGQPLITTEGANNTLEYWSIDNVGNEELPHKLLTGIKLDKTAPAGSLQINDGSGYVNSTTVTLHLLATDAGSGVSQMRFANEDSVYSNWEPYATSKLWNLTVGQGQKTVYVQYMDGVNLTVTAYQMVTLDTTLPVANAGQNQTVTIGTSVSFDGRGSTDNTGIASYMWDFGDGTFGTGATPTHNYTSVGNYTVKLTVVDLAGNKAASSSTVSIQVLIPEFSSGLLMLLVLMPMLVGVALIKKRSLKSK
jgi:PKD repeat protein